MMEVMIIARRKRTPEGTARREKALGYQMPDEAFKAEMDAIYVA